jgi:hypothetical protein
LLRQIEPDPNNEKYKNNPQLYEHDRKLHLEAKAAVKELSEKGEKLYYTEEILKEVKDVATRPDTKRENGLGLSGEKADTLIKDIKDRGLFTSLEKEIEKKIEKEAQQKAERIAESEKKTEAEKNALKEELKKELKSELEKKETRELEKAKQTLDQAQLKPEESKRTLEELRSKAVAEGKEREVKELEKQIKQVDREIKDINKAQFDTPHVAAAKAHELNILTSDKKDFRHYENLSVTQPYQAALGLKPEEVNSYREIGNRYNTPEYQGTKTYEVELKSGHKAELNIKGLDKERDARGFKDREQEVIYNPQVIERLEKWEKGTEPVRATILDTKPKDNEPNRPHILNRNEARLDDGSVATLKHHRVEESSPGQEKTHVYKVELDGQKFEVRVEGGSEKEARKTLKDLLNDKDFVRELKETKAQEKFAVVAGYAENLAQDRVEQVANERGRKVEPPPPPPPQPTIQR